MKDPSASRKSLRSKRDKQSRRSGPIDGNGTAEEASRPSPCTVLAVVVTLFILIVIIFALGEFGFHDPSAFEWDPDANRPHRKKLNESCQSSECVRFSAQLLDQVDYSIDPCSDFHSHVCARFDPQQRRLESLLKLLDTRKEQEHKKAAAIVHKMLGKCVSEKKSVGSDWKSKILPPTIPIPILMGTSSPNLTDDSLMALITHISLHTPGNIGGFLGIEPSRDSEFSLFVVKPNERPPTEYAFRNILEFLKPRGTHLDTESVEKQLEDVMKLQKRLHKIPFPMNHRVINISQIQENIKFVNWTSLVTPWYPHSSALNISLVDNIFGFDTSYYEEMSTTIAESPRETLMNLLFLHFSHNLLQTEISTDREEACLLQVASLAPGRIVIYGSAEEPGLEKLKEMLLIVRSHLRTALAKLKWMDSHGIEEALRKFERIEVQFGFEGEDEMQSLIIKPNSDYISILQTILRWETLKMFESIFERIESVYLNTEAFYHVEKNKITISRALLHYPFISSNLPEYINFATISARIVPQFVHVFDERGRFYDSNGKHRDWWNSRTQDYFHAIVACFDQNLQDVLGASISLGLNAYNSTLAPYALLPGFKNSTDVALFFYSFVNTKCTSDSKQVNRALANVPQFNEVFKCQRQLKKDSLQCQLAS